MQSTGEKKLKTRFFIVYFAVTCAVWSQSSFSIQKCRDEQGNWHYGDFAADECAKSVVTELNESGNKIGEDLPPPSAEEIKAAREAEIEAEKRQKEKQAQREADENLVHIYGSAEVIISTRDRKLTAIDNNLNVTMQMKQGILKDIESLKKRKQTAKVKELIAIREQAITSYDEVIDKTLAERGKLKHKYQEILSRFRQASERIESTH